MHLNKILNRAIIIALILPSSVPAAEWSAEPKISLRTGYNDNIRLTSAKHDSVWESALSPSVKFGVASENQGLFGDAGFAIRRFTGGSGRDSSDILNREDYHLNTNAYHNTLRDSFEANLDYTQDSTLDSELDDEGIVANERATRERITLGPSWSRMLNELTRMEMGYQFTNVGYPDGSENLVGYDYHSLTTSLARQFTPRILGTLTAGYSSYQPDTDFNSDTVSLQAGLSRDFSETLAASFLVGLRRTTSDSEFGSGFCIGAPADASFPACTGGIPVPIPNESVKAEIETTAPVYTASITKTLETGPLSASLSRSSSPSGNGELLDRTRLTLSGDYKLSEQLSSSLKIEYTENETIVNRVGFVPSEEKETFFRVTPRVSWRWRREWKLAGEYQYVDNDDPRAGTANRNAFYLSLSYVPRKRSLSR